MFFTIIIVYTCHLSDRCFEFCRYYFLGDSLFCHVVEMQYWIRGEIIIIVNINIYKLLISISNFIKIIVIYLKMAKQVYKCLKTNQKFC